MGKNKRKNKKGNHDGNRQQPTANREAVAPPGPLWRWGSRFLRYGLAFVLGGGAMSFYGPLKDYGYLGLSSFTGTIRVAMPVPGMFINTRVGKAKWQEDPIDVAAWIRVVNRDSGAVGIAGYQMEAKGPQGWHPLPRLSPSSPLSVGMRTSPNEQALAADLTGKTFDLQALGRKGKPLSAGEAIEGWAFFGKDEMALPADWKLELRLTVYDTKNERSVIEMVPEMDNSSLTHAQFTFMPDSSKPPWDPACQAVCEEKAAKMGPNCVPK